jgi:hypothetical protein
MIELTISGDGVTMKYRFLAMATAVIAFTGTGMAMAAGSAQATTARPGLLTRPGATADSFHICLMNASSLCLQSNGAGNQVTITSNSADHSNFRVANSEILDGYDAYEFENGNGNCLRAATNGDVKIENGSCGVDDAADWWVSVINGSASYLVSYDYGGRMLTHGDVSGYNVFWGAEQSGDWDSWSL